MLHASFRWHPAERTTSISQKVCRGTVFSSGQRRFRRVLMCRAMRAQDDPIRRHSKHSLLPLWKKSSEDVNESMVEQRVQEGEMRLVWGGEVG